MEGTLAIEQAPGVDVLVLRGEHDLSTQDGLEARISNALASGKSVVVDLSEVEFIDSTVLAAILHGQKRATGETDGRVQGLAVVASPGAKFVARMLSLVHIEDQVAVHLSRNSAIVSLQRSNGRAS
jgi:anti-anti-sigma factor